MAFASSPRRHWVLRFLLLGSLLYALIVLLYSVLSVHSSASLTSVRLTRLLDSLRRTPEQRQADDHALQVRLPPSGQTMERRFKCIGWRATADCSPNGARLPELDRPCTKTVPHGQSGYCELQDEGSGELFKVARRTCAEVVGKAALFRCLEAPRFTNFHVLAHEAAQRASQPGFVLPNVESVEHESQDGIVMVVYPKMVPSTYATIKVLREVLHCRLPIEIWFRQDEMRKVTASIDPLHQLVANDTIGGITFREIDDPLAIEFATKVFAIYHSAFDRVLFLDSDNVPVRDPSFLFQTPEFEHTGAVFWPDFWHPQHTMFYLGEDSLLWELLDMPFVDMFEQESGQLLIDRRRHAAPLELLRFFTFHRPNPFVQLKLVWGDKDLFRLAWLKLSVPFFMVQTPPAVAGTVNGISFCGMTMVQHDAKGEVLFLHRNSHKLTGGRIRNPADEKLQAVRKELEPETPLDERGDKTAYPDATIWTHLLSFRRSSPRSKYQIETYHAMPAFSKDQVCYGQHYLDANENFYAQAFADMSFSGLETHLRRFAMEAGQLHQAKVDALAAAQHYG
ncbi:hypothetical protein PHYPSEUDO_010712 [Phytophthora pseudosyringae]|uniref:Nucleotide-diphospho-sugar transferase n=1 Tax=Phytophthora pseudosyringae TaxID=221518 RepID=A0A8T1V9N4_9STRA|nr:hypothetical protein PHYPSEUDO_010712 [Phytophthora pseudosyringae]